MTIALFVSFLLIFLINPFLRIDVFMFIFVLYKPVSFLFVYAILGLIFV